ncbi:MAG: WD40 repeat domain-containing protein [Gemmataceae bacterium]
MPPQRTRLLIFLVVASFCFGVENAQAQELIGTLPGRFGYVNRVTFSPDGKLLAAATRTRTLYVWDVRTRKVKTKLALKEGRFGDLSFV